MNTRYDLTQLGVTPELIQTFEAHAIAGLHLGRVGAQYRGGYVLLAECGELLATAPGRMRREPGALPAVGDWVAFEPLPEGKSIVRAILPRRSKLSRAQRDANERQRAASEQVLAANIDLVFVVSALAGEFKLRRIERYLAAAWESGASPVVVLTKSDLCDDVPALVAEAETVAIGVPVYPISSTSGEGLADVRALLSAGVTAALIGSSGVGKSTLANRLLARAAQDVQEIRSDGRGRHTTTHRELFLVPGGGLILDTPGLRVLEVWDGEGLGEAFADVDELALECRFNDCRHESEPDCAVRSAIEAGALDPARLGSYRRLEAETAYLARRDDKRLQSEERRKYRVLSRDMRAGQRSGR